jgi:hypothetical protein
LLSFVLCFSLSYSVSSVRLARPTTHKSPHSPCAIHLRPTTSDSNANLCHIIFSALRAQNTRNKPRHHYHHYHHAGNHDVQSSFFVFFVVVRFARPTRKSPHSPCAIHLRPTTSDSNAKSYRIIFSALRAQNKRNNPRHRHHHHHHHHYIHHHRRHQHHHHHRNHNHHHNDHHNDQNILWVPTTYIYPRVLSPHCYCFQKLSAACLPTACNFIFQISLVFF